MAGNLSTGYRASVQRPATRRAIVTRPGPSGCKTRAWSAGSWIQRGRSGTLATQNGTPFWRVHPDPGKAAGREDGGDAGGRGATVRCFVQPSRPLPNKKPGTSPRQAAIPCIRRSAGDCHPPSRSDRLPVGGNPRLGLGGDLGVGAWAVRATPLFLFRQTPLLEAAYCMPGLLVHPFPGPPTFSCSPLVSLTPATCKLSNTGTRKAGEWGWGASSPWR